MRSRRKNTHQSNKVMKPFVFLFDIDGTIIGEILPQVCEWEIINLFDKSKLTQFKKNLCSQLKTGLIRSGFTTYLDFLKLKHPTAEFFIYTASDGIWAQFLVPCIESVIGIQFHRPLFTRKHCNFNAPLTKGTHQHHQKSISGILPILLKKLKVQYPDVTEKHIMNNICLIDNNHVLSQPESRKLIMCPSYYYIDVYDIIRLIPEEILMSQYGDISIILKKYGFFPKTDTRNISFLVFKKMYFEYVASWIKEKLKQSSQIDNFWPKLGNVMHKLDDYERLDNSVIKSINAGIGIIMPIE